MPWLALLALLMLGTSANGDEAGMVRLRGAPRKLGSAFCEQADHRDLCVPSKDSYKIGLDVSQAEAGKETEYAASIVALIKDFLALRGDRVKPAFDTDDLSLEPARYVVFEDTCPPTYELRTNGWIARYRWPVQPGADKTDLSIKRRSADDPKVNSESAEKMITATGVSADYKLKTQWIAGSTEPKYQLYAQFKGADFDALKDHGLDLTADQNPMSAWGKIVPALGSVASPDTPTQPNNLRIRQEEIVLLDGSFYDSSGKQSKFEPSVILWYQVDANGQKEPHAFAGELTWDIKAKHGAAAQNHSKEKLWAPLVELLEVKGMVDKGTKTEKAYKRMSGLAWCVERQR